MSEQGVYEYCSECGEMFMQMDMERVCKDCKRKKEEANKEKAKE